MKTLSLCVLLLSGVIVTESKLPILNSRLLTSKSAHSAHSAQLYKTQSSLHNGLIVAQNVNTNSPSNSSGSMMQIDSNIASEVLAGFVVALATIPKAIAYSSVIGVSPLTGIWTSVIVSVCITMLGNCPGLISGAAGVLILPMSKMMHTQGSHFMAASVILSGIFECLFGLSRSGKLLDIVSENVIAGFLSAVVIFLLKTQVSVFKGSDGLWLPAYPLYSSIGISLLCAGVTQFLPLITNSKIPPSLVGLVLSSGLVAALKLPIKSLADSAGKGVFVGGLKALPTFTGFPTVPLNLATLSMIFSTALGAAIIAVVETVLAQKIFFNAYRSRTPSPQPDDADRASIGLGVGNILSALIGGFGGCGLIPNTMLNGSSGGYGYVSAYSFAACMALAVVVFSPVLGLIPMASLAGVMLTVGVNTMEWKELWHLATHAVKTPQDFMNLLAALVTTVLCYEVDMGLGVVVGVALTQLLPALSLAKRRVLEAQQQGSHTK